MVTRISELVGRVADGMRTQKSGSWPEMRMLPTQGRSGRHINMQSLERLTSGGLGAWLILRGAASRNPLGRLFYTALGGGLAYRAATGHCPIRQIVTDEAQHYLTHSDSARSVQSVQQDTVTIGRPLPELFEMWQSPQVIRAIFADVGDVTLRDDHRLHWIVRTPMGRQVEVRTTVLERRPNESVRWQSDSDSPVACEGAVEFRPAPLDLGTEVSLSLGFGAPGGKLGQAALNVLGYSPKLVVEKALRRFKCLAETGEIPTLDRQPAARQTGRDSWQ